MTAPTHITTVFVTLHLTLVGPETFLIEYKIILPIPLQQRISKYIIIIKTYMLVNK